MNNTAYILDQFDTGIWRWEKGRRPKIDQERKLTNYDPELGTRKYTF